jgi:tetratricopeptide (TPR) repeat protein
MATYLFWPALSGPFLFDDFPNLSALADTGGISSAKDLLIFVLSGSSSLGRPLAFLTFAMNDQAWPSDPWAFKYTNLMIHLLNGVLVFVLARQLLRLTGVAPAQRRDALALAAMALWLLHPMQLATMMLVVQRMTQLSALFTLAGLAAFVHGREIASQRPLAGYAWLSLGIGAGGLLAVLSKENGILLPLYALVIEATILRAAAIPQPPYYWKLWQATFLWLPLLALLAFFAAIADRFDDEFARRPFTLGERLLTEARIMFDYLGRILIPRLQGSGLFHDDYPISRGLLTPWTTLPAVLGVIAAIGFAWRVRRRWPPLAFGILWFFAGHALESTFLWLELYFEHRNYLPMVGPLLAATYYLFQIPARIRKLAPAALAAVLAFLAFMSWQSATIWGDRALIATVWAAENPTSPRAQQYLAQWHFDKGRLEKAREVTRRALDKNPKDPELMLQTLRLNCLTDRLEPGDFTSVLDQLRHARHSGGSLNPLSRLRKDITNGYCEALDLAALISIYEALLSNDNFTNHPAAKRNLLYSKGVVAARSGNLPLAMRSLNEAYETRPGVNIRLRQAEWLLSAGRPEVALKYVQKAAEYPLSLRQRLLGIPDQIQRLKQSLQRKIDTSSQGAQADRDP